MSCGFLWVRNEVKLPAFSAGFTTASQVELDRVQGEAQRWRRPVLAAVNLGPGTGL